MDKQVDKSKTGGGKLFHLFIQMLLSVYGVAMALFSIIGPKKRALTEAGSNILLTGTFYSDNWISSHLRPLAMSKQCKKLTIVSIYPVPPIDKVELIVPPTWLIKIIGGVPARMVTFVLVGIRTRPDIVGGFHLLFNGLLAALLGRMVGARSMYFCVGGPAEVLNGGINSENKLFEKLVTPNLVVETKLLNVIDAFDLVITMGTTAAQFFIRRGVKSDFHVVSGGLDADSFFPGSNDPSADLIIVGRLAPIKRMDIYLRAVRCLKDQNKNVQAIIVGDGQLREELVTLASELGIEEQIVFAGHQSDIASWLKKSKIFVLTSDSEGLSLALMEAMLTGLPAVVSDVGDLGDVVENGESGYLVKERTPEAFATRISDILSSPEKLHQFSESARKSACRYELSNCVKLWDSILDR